MKFINIFRIFLLVLIIIGVVLLFTQKFWVPKLVNRILSTQSVEKIPLTKPTTKTFDTSSWKTFSDGVDKFSFKYPGNISTKYISTVDWPPKVQVVQGPFVCTDAGEEIAVNGKTENRIINGHTYCVTTSSEGAAGSTYTQYAYATKVQNQTLNFTFTLRFVQCANYDDPQKTACEQERAAFNIDPTIDQIVQTFQFL